MPTNNKKHMGRRDPFSSQVRAESAVDGWVHGSHSAAIGGSRLTG